MTRRRSAQERSAVKMYGSPPSPSSEGGGNTCATPPAASTFDLVPGLGAAAIGNCTGKEPLDQTGIHRATIVSKSESAVSGSNQSAGYNRIVNGDSRSVLRVLPDESVDLSFWSPPYFVGKSYEKDMSFDDWQQLIQEVIKEHGRLLKPGGFMAVNIGDILCFVDPSMPRFQANNVRGKRNSVSLVDIQKMQSRYPKASRYELAKLLGCSEQTVQRRLEGNNVRGGKAEHATKVMLTGCLLTEWAENCGLYLYDRRVWWKDPCWINSRWHSTSYRAVDEFEHVYVYWRPGVVEYDRERLSADEWSMWGSRAVWKIPSVRRNHRHEAEFPEELATRVIRLFSPVGGLVIDPFVGSGTTTAVAKRLERRWLGVDSDAAAVNLARSRADES